MIAIRLALSGIAWFFGDDDIARWVALVVWTAVSLMLSIPARRRLFGSPTAEERLRDDLIERVEKLEAELDAERKRHAAEMTIMRHRVNNSDQCLDALLLLLKTAPDKVEEAVRHIEEMRVRQQKAIALEKGAALAVIAGTAVE